MISNIALRVGDVAPDTILPDGRSLKELRGAPLILAFAPSQWNPAIAYQSELFSQLALEFSDGASFIDASTDDWLSLSNKSELAEAFGVTEERVIFVLDENGILRFHLTGQNLHPGEVISALEELQKTHQNGKGLSRRTFLCSTFAAAALLSVAGWTQAAPSNHSMTPPAQRERSEYKGNYALDDTIPVTLNINGKKTKLQIEPRVALLDALREYAGLTGTKKGCDHGQCGACTVHVDGQRQLSCLTLAVMNEGRQITTIEGLANGETLHPVQQAFIENDGFQCGYCTPGQIMSAVALIKEGKAKTDAEIRESMSGNLCRCAAYPNIVAAIKQAQSMSA